MSASFEFGAPDHFTAGAIGPPGQRVFYLQSREKGTLVTLKSEKEQVRALELRRIHGGDLRQLVDPGRDDVRMALTLLGQMQTRRLARQNLAGRRCLAVANQEDEGRAHRQIIAVSRSSSWFARRPRSGS